MSGITSGSHVAERLYYDSPDLRFSAKITDIQLVAREQASDGGKTQLWRVALDRTAFYPESGGQPWDTGLLVATARSGAILEVAVERVEEDEAGEVWHFVRKPLVEGTEVEGRIDATRRLDHMQQHSGQHLLSTVFLERLNARTISFHLGSESSTIDLVLPTGVPAIEKDQVKAVEGDANRIISEDRPLKVRWYAREEAEAMLAGGELRKLPDRTGPLRVVEIEGVELNACGGTHVGSTGAIGSLLTRRLEKIKQGWRLEFVCGGRALRAAGHDYEVLTETAKILSVGTDDVPSRVAAMQEEIRSIGKARRTLLEELADTKAAELLSASSESGTLLAVFPDKPIEFAKRIASTVAASGRAVVIGVSEGAKGAVAVALATGDPRHAGDLLREVSLAYEARGGGGPQLAQGVCDPNRLSDLVQGIVQQLA